MSDQHIIMGDLIVVVASNKLPVIVLYCAILALVSSCGRSDAGDQAKTTDQAIDQAVRELEQFGKSFEVARRGEPEIDLTKLDLTGLEGVSASKGKASQKVLEKLSSDQVKEFNQALDQLKGFASKPS